MYNLNDSIQQAIIQNGRADKVLPRKGKAKKFIIIKPSLHEMLKGNNKKKKINTMNIKMAINSQL